MDLAGDGGMLMKEVAYIYLCMNLQANIVLRSITNAMQQAVCCYWAPCLAPEAITRIFFNFFVNNLI